MGINWGLTLIGFMCLLLVPVPYLFYKRGSRIRQRSEFAPCIVSIKYACLGSLTDESFAQDFKIAKQLKDEKMAQRPKVLEV